MGSSSQRGTFRIVPGIDIGTTEEPLRQPAFPKEAPSPGAPGSSTNTLWPSRCRKLAAVMPTMPAPITPTVLAMPPLSAHALAAQPLIGLDRECRKAAHVAPHQRNHDEREHHHVPFAVLLEIGEDRVHERRADERACEIPEPSHHDHDHELRH